MILGLKVLEEFIYKLNRYVYMPVSTFFEARLRKTFTYDLKTNLASKNSKSSQFENELGTSCPDRR